MEGLNSLESYISTLPKGDGWLSSDDLCLYQFQGFWFWHGFFKEVFDDPESSRWKLSSSDILVCSIPKGGTTWLKALAFAIVTRALYQHPNTNPLLSSNPHDLIKFIEFPHYTRNLELPLVSTHMSYTSLPKSITDCGCKMIYICRDPKDAFVSLWLFAQKMRPNKDSTEPISLDKAFHLFCSGVSPFGPYWDHVLGYWKASIHHPNGILFLKYEDMMRDPYSHVISIAKYMGYPFSKQEEIEGVPMKIVEMCSFDKLSNLEVNKSEKVFSTAIGETFPNNHFFRKGEVGDWRNYLTQEMANKIDQITKEKLNPFGLQL